MRRMGDLMKDLGFNAEAPVETQKAFIRHLIRVANGQTPREPSPIQAARPAHEPAAEVQLSFDPEILGVAKKFGSAR